MKFDGYTKDNTGAYMVLIYEDFILRNNKGKVYIDLQHIWKISNHTNYDETIQGSVLKDKYGRKYIISQTMEEICSEKLPKGFKWNDGKYERVMLFDKKTAIVSNPEFLLSKLKKACEDAEV